MEWMEELKSGLERVERESIEALKSVQAELMSFFDHLKQHLTQNPEPVFAVVAKTPAHREINNIAAAISPRFCYKS